MILKGIDTFEFGLEISNYEITFRSFLDRLKELKEQSHLIGNEPTINIGELELTVHRTGQKFYAYRLSCKDFLIAFMDKETANNTPVFIKFLSSYLWSYGLEEAYTNFLKWFKNFNAEITIDKVSRVDICMDSEQISFNKSDVKGVVTRAKSKSEFFVNQEFTTGRQFSGFQIGRGDPMLARIYNKSIEIKKSGKIWFEEIWLKNKWDSTKPVWRVEFQLRRNVLKEFSAENFENFIHQQKELWSYLTVNWLSIRQPSKDNISRWKLKRKWNMVQKADLDYVADPAIREIIKEGNIKRLLDQAAGLMLSIASITDHSSINETSSVLQSWVNVKLMSKNTSFENEKISRQLKYL